MTDEYIAAQPHGNPSPRCSLISPPSVFLQPLNGLAMAVMACPPRCNGSIYNESGEAQKISGLIVSSHETRHQNGLTLRRFSFLRGFPIEVIHPRPGGCKQGRFQTSQIPPCQIRPSRRMVKRRHEKGFSHWCEGLANLNLQWREFLFVFIFIYFLKSQTWSLSRDNRRDAVSKRPVNHSCRCTVSLKTKIQMMCPMCPDFSSKAYWIK